MEVETRPVVAVIADMEINIKDRITLPDGTQPDIDSVEKYNYVSGLHHTVVVFR